MNNLIQEGPYLKFKFKKCADLPTAMSDLQCAIINNRVYVGGGTGEDKTDHAAQSQVFEYSLLDKAWHLLSHNPARFFGLATFLGRLVSIGGRLPDNTITGKIGVFNFAKGSWDEDKIPSMPTKRCYPTVVSHGKYLAVCGGVTQGGGTTDIVEVLINNEQWCSGPRLPHRLCLAKQTMINHSCYLTGGACSVSPLQLLPSNSLLSISLSSLVSQPATPPRESSKRWDNHRNHFSDSFAKFNSDTNYYPTIANHGGIMLMIGGWNQDLMAPNEDIYAYSPIACMWVKVQKLPKACCSLAASAQLPNGAIMLIGGVEKVQGKSRKISSVMLMSLDF